MTIRVGQAVPVGETNSDFVDKYHLTTFRKISGNLAYTGTTFKRGHPLRADLSQIVSHFEGTNELMLANDEDVAGEDDRGFPIQYGYPLGLNIYTVASCTPRTISQVVQNQFSTITGAGKFLQWVSPSGSNPRALSAFIPEDSDEWRFVRVRLAWSHGQFVGDPPTAYDTLVVSSGNNPGEVVVVSFNDPAYTQCEFFDQLNLCGTWAGIENWYAFQSTCGGQSYPALTFSSAVWGSITVTV